MQIKKCIVDYRMRKIEKDYLRQKGYEIIENNKNLDLYDEISAHVDISYVKIENEIIISPDKSVEICNKTDYIVGKSILEAEYPKDVPYNVCIMGKKAIHNFNFTDRVVLEKINKFNYKKIDVNQGYSRCAISVVDQNSCITSDIGIAKTLLDEGIDVLYIYEPDIKLLKNDYTINKDGEAEYSCSDMQGFIGGATATINDEYIIFGDINNLINKEKIIKFVEDKGKRIKWFDNLDIIDYGSVLEI